MRRRAFLAVSLQLAAIGATRADEVIEDTVVADEPAGAVAEDTNAVPGDSIAGGTANKKKPFALDPALELADPRTYRLKVTIRIQAVEAPVKNVVATGPIPMDWPEQSVRLLSQKISPQARVSESVLKGQAAILRFQVAQIPQGGSAFVERLYEITRYRTKFGMPGDDLKVPRGVPAELKDQVTGVPPGMEIKHSKMINLAESLRKSSEDSGPWDTIKTIWSWTRDNIKFQNGDFRGALYAIENRTGDCEEMSALFVGLCRLSGIPARTV
ncbi:MAG TPA: transglutaminase-like domain-containing protein, partial [Pirellulales bacterium]|nr:transglutaminase-like domain-containing protein [Pirellulales bacterium]